VASPVLVATVGATLAGSTVISTAAVSAALLSSTASYWKPSVPVKPPAGS
jgi:hypothetical protein